jgi:hypothetical protein
MNTHTHRYKSGEILNETRDLFGSSPFDLFYTYTIHNSIQNDDILVCI